MERNIVMTCQIIMAHIAKFQYIATNMAGFHRWLQNIGTEKGVSCAVNLFMTKNLSLRKQRNALPKMNLNMTK